MICQGLRINTNLKKWWIDRPFIPVILIITGILMLVISHYKGLQTSFIWEDNLREKRSFMPNIYLLLCGWFFICFACLHIFPKARNPLSKS